MLRAFTILLTFSLAVSCILFILELNQPLGILIGLLWLSSWIATTWKDMNR